MLSTALGSMTQIPQWFVWRLTWDAATAKYKKMPAWPAHRTDLDRDNDTDRREGHDAQNPKNWTTYQQAVVDIANHQARFDGYQYTLGFMLTADSGFWFLDADECVKPDGTLTPWASWFMTNLSGVLIEYSSSGRGLHFIGRGPLPEHRTRPSTAWAEQNPGNDLEFYSGARGIAFGLTGQAWGSADDIMRGPVADWIARNIFAADVTHVVGAACNGPRSDWRGPTDDDDLLRRAFNAKKGVDKLFSGKAGFADLWNRNVPVLAKTYPRTDSKAQFEETEADFALAVYLAFWTGCDAERVERLMWRSQLVRAKWTEHRTYLRELTVARACAKQTVVCQDKIVEQQITVQTSAEASATRLDYFNQIMDAEDDGQLRNEIIPVIAHDRTIEPLDRDFLAKAIKDRLNQWAFPVSINECRQMLATRTIEDAEQVVPEWAHRFVYDTSNDTFFNLQTAQSISRTSFNAEHNRLMPSRPNGTKEDATTWCLERWGTATVTNTMYWPGREPLFQHEGAWYANLYCPSAIPEVAISYTQEGVDAINAFLAHVKAFCDGRADVFANMLDWMAWNVQNPGKKCRYMPLLKGIQGDGKTMIVSAMRAAMGGRNVGSVGANLLSTDFTDWAEGTCVTGFEEMMITGRKRYSIANSLKEPIANSYLTINRKGVASGVTVRNVTNYIGFTNHVDAVPLEDSDRRYWIIFSRYQSKKEVEVALGLSIGGLGAHFDRIFDSMEDGRRGEWRKFFTEYQVSDAFKPNGDAPWTPEKGEMRSSGEDVHEAVARQVIDGGALGVTSTVLSSACLTSAMRTVCVADGIELPKTSAVNHMLSRMGFSQYGATVWWEGKMHRVWWKRGAIECKDTATVRSMLELSKMKLQGV